MTRTRSSDVERTEVAIDAAVHALAAADLDAVTSGDHTVSFSLDGKNHRFRVAAVAYCTGQRARDLVGRRPGPHLVVSEKITSDGRAVLSDAGWSWLDRRGRLHLRAPGVRIDVDVPADQRLPIAPPPEQAITGRSGLTVAYWLCDHPGDSLSPTRSAKGLALAPSTISTTVRRLADAGLVDEAGFGVLPELFWELAASWHPERTWLLAVPQPERHRSVDPRAPGWRRTGTAAALAYGAPIVTTADEPVELYVVGPVEVSIAVREYGAARPGRGAASIMVPPVSAVSSVDGTLPLVDGWAAAPILAVALDLAQDRARGREMLDSWNAADAPWR